MKYLTNKQSYHFQNYLKFGPGYINYFLTNTILDNGELKPKIND